jgi:hypothetical protein
MKTWLKYLITALVGLIFAGTYCITNGLVTETDPVKVFKILSDAFTVPGMLLVCIGCFQFCVSHGAFYGIQYVVHSLLVNHNWSRTKFKDKETYAEYVEAKKAKAGDNAGTPYLFFVGLLFILISVVFVIAYHNVQ